MSGQRRHLIALIYLKTYFRFYIKKHFPTYTSFTQESTNICHCQFKQKCIRLIYADYSLTLAAIFSLFTVVLLPSKIIIPTNNENTKYIFGPCQSLSEQVFLPQGGDEIFVVLFE